MASRQKGLEVSRRIGRQVGVLDGPDYNSKAILVDIRLADGDYV